MLTDTPTAATIDHDAPAWFSPRRGVVPDTAPHRLGEVLGLMGVQAVDADGRAGSAEVRQLRVRAGSLFCEEGAPLRALYLVRHGSFKWLRYAEDGYEHVFGFATAGDLLGFEGLAAGRQPLGVMALEDAGVLVLPLAELELWRRQHPALDQALLRALATQLVRAREHAAMMAAVAAEVRLARFLVWMSGWMASRGQSPRRFVLRMSRRDIASLLAVAHETVSRSFGLLAEWGYLRVDNRDVEILDMAGLKACTRSTRRDTDDPHHRGGVLPAAGGIAGAAARAAIQSRASLNSSPLSK